MTSKQELMLIPVPESPLPSNPPTLTAYTLAFGAHPKFKPVAVPPQ